MNKNSPILQVEDLRVSFGTRRGTLEAVDGVNLCLDRGEILGLVGESGCGKSVTAQAIMRLIGNSSGEYVAGRILMDGDDLMLKSEREMSRLRGKRMSMIFQDPMSSLNPVYTVGWQIAEVPIIHDNASRGEAHARAVEMLGMVGIPSPEDRVRRYPHEFSGGMRQRTVIGMSLSCKPDLLIADEPTTALDVTIQAQIIDLLLDLRRNLGTAIILITHDLGVVAEMCDRVAIMYSGYIVEQAPVHELFDNPRHPYTKGLLDSLPRAGRRGRLNAIKGRPPDPGNLPEGCRFAPRCPHAFEKCSKFPTIECVGGDHHVACWLEKKSE